MDTDQYTVCKANMEKYDVPFHNLGNLFYFCWNKLCILGCLYIMYNIVVIRILCGVTKNNGYVNFVDYFVLFVHENFVYIEYTSCIYIGLHSQV